jgi:hypothetical protein
LHQYYIEPVRDGSKVPSLPAEFLDPPEGGS